MKTRLPLFAATAAIVVLCGASLPAQSAQRIETLTRQVQPPPGQRMLDLRVYDTNGDGRLDRGEVAEMMFNAFDTNLSGTLEPSEFYNRSLQTVVPMERETRVANVTRRGRLVSTQTSLHTFMQATPLAAFDPGGTGLSPNKFIGLPFSAIDTNGDGRIDIDEWRNAYIRMRGF